MAFGSSENAEEKTADLEPELTLPDGLTKKQAERIEAGAVDCTICLGSVPVSHNGGVPVWKLCKNGHVACDVCMKELRSRGNPRCPLCQGSAEFVVHPLTRAEGDYYGLISAFMGFKCPECGKKGFDTKDDVTKHLREECSEVKKTFSSLDMEEELTAKKCAEKLAETQANSLKLLAKAFVALRRELGEATTRIQELEALEEECKKEDARLAEAVPRAILDGYAWVATLFGFERVPGHKTHMNTAANATGCQVNGRDPLFACLRQPRAHEDAPEMVRFCYLLGELHPGARKKEQRREVLCGYLENGPNGLEVRLTSLGVHVAERLLYVVPGDVPREGPQLLLYEVRIKIKQLLAKGRVNENDKEEYSAFGHLWTPSPGIVVLDDSDDDGAAPAGAAPAGAAQD